MLINVMDKPPSMIITIIREHNERKGKSNHEKINYKNNII